jgi:hypothetical protein
MATGLEVRAQIDSENAKGLLLINGGAAVALLAFLPSILGKSGLESVAQSVLFALCIFLFGLTAAVVHNRLRRICSLVYESQGFRPAPCRFIPRWMSRGEPCVCAASTTFMWCSLIAFVVGGSVVAYGGLGIVKYKDGGGVTSCWQLQELRGRVYRVNSCTGWFEVLELPPETHNKSLKQDAPKTGAPG